MLVSWWTWWRCACVCECEAERFRHKAIIADLQDNICICTYTYLCVHTHTHTHRACSCCKYPLYTDYTFNNRFNKKTQTSDSFFIRLKNTNNTRRQIFLDLQYGTKLNRMCQQSKHHSNNEPSERLLIDTDASGYQFRLISCSSPLHKQVETKHP